MKIIFFGSSKFAVLPLETLAGSSNQIICVVTQPDRQKGRGLCLEATAVKAAALKLGLSVYQPQSVNTASAIKFLKEKAADLYVVVSFGQILSREVLESAKIFSINAHASLLPKLRGAAPVNWAIINGETTTGVTIIKMAPKMDAGPIIVQEAVRIEESDSAPGLEDKLSRLASKLLLESVKLIENNSCRLQEQDEQKATFAPKLKKETGLIDWNKKSREIHNLIRGCLNWPGAYTYYGAKLLKIFKSRREETQYTPKAHPGEIVKANKQGITVAGGDGEVVIEELQLEGKRRMHAAEFIAGHEINIKDRLGKK